MAVDKILDRSKAGALIPTDVSREIIKGIPQKSAAMQLMRKVTMSSKETKQPVLATLPEAHWLTGDTGLKQTTDVSWTNKMLVAEELAVIVAVPEAVLDDSEYDLWAEIDPLLREAFAVAIDEAVLFGVNKPSGWTDAAIVPGAVAAGNSLALNSIAGKDIVSHVNATMGLVEEDGYDVNGFAARRGVRSMLRDLRATDGTPIFNQSLQGDGTANASIYGEPVAYMGAGWVDTAATLIAGDWQKAILGIRQDITLKRFDQGVITDANGAVKLNLMQQDSVALRAVMRIGYAVATPITRFNAGNANRYPFGVLTPAAGG